MSQERVNVQVTRWIFTLNNFDPIFKYRDYLSEMKHKVKRGVWGREIAPETGTPHLQGYLEFFRTVRLAHVRRIFATAHWEAARGSSLSNFEYCTKEGDYETVGDFTLELHGETDEGNERKRPASIPMIIRGLLSEDYSLQIKVSKEYSDRHTYFDRVSKNIKALTYQHKMFEQWKDKQLYPWQYTVLQRIMSQTERQIVWIVDSKDGVITGRDLGSILKPSNRGVVFDVCRSALNNFDYSVVESLKNGILMSGKYRGEYKTFHPMKIAIFANNFPDFSQLSEDRWDIIVLGDNEFRNLDKTAVVAPSSVYPFVEPRSLPELNEKFCLREFLEGRICDENGLIDLPFGYCSSQTDATGPPVVAPPRTTRIHTSQTAGPSTAITEIQSQSSQQILDLSKRVMLLEKGAFCAKHPNVSNSSKGCSCKIKRVRNEATTVNLISVVASVATSEITEIPDLVNDLPTNDVPDISANSNEQIEERLPESNEIDNSSQSNSSQHLPATNSPEISATPNSVESIVEADTPALVLSSSSDELPSAQPAQVNSKRKSSSSRLSLKRTKGTSEKQKEDSDFISDPEDLIISRKKNKIKSRR